MPTVITQVLHMFGFIIFFLNAIKYVFFLPQHLTNTSCTSKYCHKSPVILHGMRCIGSHARAFRVGKPTQILISQLRSTKKENTCTGFHISLLHILMSLLRDSNNQETRIHTSSSSTSFLKDSSY